ncbi:tetratricopeptide repeat protein [Fibrobacter sp.]|uniref:tetratricopeptide repeat protein n=1 Tax=Fibrobacter sp. TaxID=35828 RepID=UPI003417DE52
MFTNHFPIFTPMAKVVQITAENFEAEVIQASETRAVAILFSSAEYPDCAPYSQLLGQLSTSMDFTLGVVSCDDRENMRLIQMFRVQSVPEIHIVEKGQIADVIQGVLPEADLKKRLEKFYVSDEARMMNALEEAIADKRYDEALPLLNNALSKSPNDKKLQLLWAKASLGMGDTEKAKEILNKFNEADDQYREAKSLLELLDFHAEVAKKDVQGKEAIVYHEACKLACEEQFEAALQAFLNLFIEAPDWNDGAAKKAMLTLFGVLGPKHELTWKYRAKLNTMMFI